MSLPSLAQKDEIEFGVVYNQKHWNEYQTGYNLSHAFIKKQRIL